MMLHTKANNTFYHDYGAGDIGFAGPSFLKRFQEAGLDPKKTSGEVDAKWIDENIWYEDTLSGTIILAH